MVCICGLFVVYMWSICGLHVVRACLGHRPTVLRRIGGVVRLNCEAPRAGARFEVGDVGPGFATARVLLMRAALLRLGLPQFLGLQTRITDTTCLQSR